MKLGFIILGHKRPDLLSRMARALDGRPCALHIDAKSSMFGEAVEALKDLPNIHYLPRGKVYWGAFGHTEASLKGLRWFRTTDCDYVALLTAQCYPLRSISSIENSLAKLKGGAVIEFESFPHPRWEGGGWPRVERFYVQAYGRQRPIKLWRRHMPLGLHPYGGSSYWCVSRPAAEYILNFIDANPSFVRFFQNSLIPDEIFFHTILANSPFRDTLINDSTHYIEWVSNQPNPLTLKRVDDAFASGKWFARKFEELAMLDAIDERRAQTASSEAFGDIVPSSVGVRQLEPARL
jgi:hypothetical protein